MPNHLKGIRELVEELRDASRDPESSRVGQRCTYLGFRIFLALPPQVHLGLAHGTVHRMCMSHASNATHPPWVPSCLSVIEAMINYPPARTSEDHPWSNRGPGPKPFPAHLDGALGHLWAAASLQTIRPACAENSALALTAAFGSSPGSPEDAATHAGSLPGRGAFGAQWLGVAEEVALLLAPDEIP